VNELDLVRVACEELPAPSEVELAFARDALRHEIAATSIMRRTGGRLRVVVVGSFGLAAAVAVIVAFVLTTDETSFGVRIAAAATEAASPTANELVHSVSRTTIRSTNRVGTTTFEQRDYSWSASSPPVEVDRATYATGSLTTLTSACGSISYDPAGNLFTVQPTAKPIDPVHDPVAAARSALRSGHVHFRGKLLYKGIAAAKLVVTQYGSTTTYIVRRDNGYPLETIGRRVTLYRTRPTMTTTVTTYSLFERVERTPQALSHVKLTPRRDAFIVRTAPASSTPACAGFGSFEALIGRRTVT
jgi:hypothetical protein